MKIRVEKIVFSFFPLKFEDVIKSYFIISIIIYNFLRRPVLDLKIPLMVAMPFVATQSDSSHVQFEVDKENSFIKHIQHICQQVHDILDRANAK